MAMSSSQRILLTAGAAALILAVGGAWYMMSGETAVETNKNQIIPGETASKPSEQNPTPSDPQRQGHLITLKTSMGEIQFRTFDSDAPKTVQNFITLAQKGFYDNVSFHRVIKGFMIQGGDPKGDGTGGPGYAFEDELNPAAVSYREGYKKGVVAMANAGPDTNGSQFFIMLENYPLPNNYTIFGKVEKGQEVVDAIGSVKTGANDRPLTAVTIKSIKVEDTNQ